MTELELAPASRQALEVADLLAMIATLASTDLGRRFVAELVPLADEWALVARRQAYEEVAQLCAEQPLVGGREEPFAALIAALEQGGGELGGRDLLALAWLMRTASEAHRRLLARADASSAIAAASTAPTPAAAQRPLADRWRTLPDLAPLARQIERTLDRRGEVREDASPELERLRGQIRRVRDQLYGELGAIVARHGDVVDSTIPLRGGRLMLVLDAGARGRLGGLVHGRSGTAKSFYFEPLEVVETNNHLQQAVEDEEAERRRILLALLGEVRAVLPALVATGAFVAELDGWQAAWQFAVLADARLAELVAADEPPSVRLVAARHPLLDGRLAELRAQALGQAGHRGAVVPLDLVLDGSTRVLVVTGPNAGGKTVVLKTLGLLAVAHQCGLPIPAAAGTRLPNLVAVVATVGDEQDLLADRSTFSGRLLRLAEAFGAARTGSALILLDELGSGTGPEEGAALAIALLEALLEPPAAGRANLALITTHLTQLAAAALDLPGADCAAMEFLPASGQPSYRLLPGPPGGSEAIALARRLGLPEPWLRRAEELLGSEHRELRRLLAELERARAEVLATEERLAEAGRDAERLRDRLAEQSAALDAERRALAPRLERELAAFKREATVRLRGELERVREEATAGRRRGVVEAAVERLLEPAPRLAEAPAAAAGPLRLGAEVRHRLLGWRGRLERLESERAEVLVQGKRLRCSPSDLDTLAAGRDEQPSSGSRRPRGGAVVEPELAEPPAELHLIGRRVEEALGELEGYLDAMLRSARREVRVVHGHGSGRLRQAVREHLRHHPAVAAQRPGAPNEGGDGATVVTLREA